MSYFQSLLNRNTGLNNASQIGNTGVLDSLTTGIDNNTNLGINGTNNNTNNTNVTYPSTFIGSKNDAVPYSIYTSKPAVDATNKNLTDLNVLNSGGANPTAQKMLGDVQNTLGTNQVAGLSSAIQELLTRFNKTSSDLTTAQNNANSANQTGNMKTLNEYMTSANKLNEERTKTLNDLYSQVSPLQKSLISSLTPGQQEIDLQNQYLNKQQELGQYDIETQKGVYGLEGQGRGITSGLVSGQQAKLQQQRALGRTSMAQEEANLLSRLGLAQDARTASQEAIKTGMSILSTNYDMQTKARDAIDKQNTTVLTQANTLSDNARATLTNILEKFKGLDFETLDDQSKTSLSALAQSSGIDLGILKAGMKAVKDQQDFTNSLDTYKAQESANSSAKNAAGLTPSQINTTINGIASAFDNEQTVKTYNIATEGYQTLKSIGTDTKSPADDIAFIYGFAKIMDPNSVVREGEYNTVQKYAQTWADNFGFTAKRIFSNTNFLSKDAKQKMLNSLEAKMGSITSQYKNVYNEYQRQIKDAASGNTRSITDYSKAFDTGDAPKTTLMTGPDNKQYNVPNDQVEAFTKAGGHK